MPFQYHDAEILPLLGGTGSILLFDLSVLFSDEEQDLNDDTDIAPMDSDSELLDADKLEDGPLIEVEGLLSLSFPFLKKNFTVAWIHSG